MADTKKVKLTGKQKVQGVWREAGDTVEVAPFEADALKSSGRAEDAKGSKKSE